MKILQINSSIKGAASASTGLATEIVARLKTLVPESTVEVRDLAADPLPALDPAALGALFTPADKRTPEQLARVAVDDAVIAQLQAAEALVIGVPMYNLDTPIQLKAWLDAISRAGVTFRYTETGPVGLLGGKKVYLAFARGGIHLGTPLDTQTAYLTNMLRFLGLSDITCVYAEGLNMGEEPAAQGLAKARAAIAAIAV